ncbi:MAG: DUF302 domain-containing protein [Thioalkalivibrio sp.]|nr:DUF302 domain-containing protein [Thioalkalivibrio sp.]
MNRRIASFLLLLICLPALSAATASEGMIVTQSPFGPGETMDRLQAVVEDRELTVFARIDHAAGAERIGETLRPTELLIFGNPRGGTPFMQCAQSVGIDLPLKALVWQDAQDRVWVGYNDPVFLAERHGVPDCPVAPNLANALDNLVTSALGD